MHSLQSPNFSLQNAPFGNIFGFLPTFLYILPVRETFYFVIGFESTLFLLKFHALMSHVCTGFCIVIMGLRGFFWEVGVSRIRHECLVFLQNL